MGYVQYKLACLVTPPTNETYSSLDYQFQKKGPQGRSALKNGRGPGEVHGTKRPTRSHFMSYPTHNRANES